MADQSVFNTSHNIHRFEQKKVRAFHDDDHT